MYGIVVAVMVRNWTLASSGSEAMYSTASARAGSNGLDRDRAVGLRHAAVQAGSCRWPRCRCRSARRRCRTPGRPATGLGQPGHRVLGGGVADAARPRRVRRDRAVVDDAAAPGVLRLHHPHRVLGAQEGAGEVDVDHGPPVGQVDLVGRAGRPNTPALLTSRSRRPQRSWTRSNRAATDGGEVTSAGTARAESAAGSAAWAACAVGPARPPAARQRDLPARAEQAQRDAPAQPRTGPGDNRDAHGSSLLCSGDDGDRPAAGPDQPDGQRPDQPVPGLGRCADDDGVGADLVRHPAQFVNGSPAAAMKVSGTPSRAAPSSACCRSSAAASASACPLRRTRPHPPRPPRRTWPDSCSTYTQTRRAPAAAPARPHTPRPAAT